MLTLKRVKELVEAPSHAKRTPSPKMLFEEGIVLLRREFDQGSHLTVYNSGYVLFSAGKRNTVFHIHDCCGDYAYDAAEGKGDVIEEEYFENCEWHIRALFEGERKMEDNQAKCEGAGRSNVCVSYHALSEDWSEIADRTINNFRKERNDWKLDLCVGDGADAIELEIFAEPNPPKRVNRPEACGLRHLAFRVENVEATVEELAQMGIECEPIRLDSYTKKKMTFFFDPDGLPLELHE